jgi:hypothetical protein
MPRKPLYERWTAETDDVLRQLWAKPLTVSAIARRMKRSPGTIQMKAAALGLPRRMPGDRLPLAGGPDTNPKLT